MRFAAVAVAGACAALAGIAPAGGGEGPRPARAKQLRAGDPAPDFELALLEQPEDAKKEDAKEKDGDTGEPPKTPPPAPKAPEKVRLSSFRGKSAVVLVFSSYT